MSKKIKIEEKTPKADPDSFEVFNHEFQILANDAPEEEKRRIAKLMVESYKKSIDFGNLFWVLLAEKQKRVQRKDEEDEQEN